MIVLVAVLSQKPYLCCCTVTSLCVVCCPRVVRRSHSSRGGPRQRPGRPMSMFCDEQGWPLVESGELPPQWLSGEAKDAVPVEEPVSSLAECYREEVRGTGYYDNYAEMCKVNSVFSGIAVFYWRARLVFHVHRSARNAMK